MNRREDDGAPAALSAYRIVWLMVLFDLPVGTKGQRKRATKFRHSLLDLGFEMSQYSVYLRFCAGKEQADAYVKAVERKMPTAGKVHIVQITDKQYENIRTFRGGNVSVQLLHTCSLFQSRDDFSPRQSERERNICHGNSGRTCQLLASTH